MSSTIAGVAAAVAAIRECKRIESALLLRSFLVVDSISACVRPDFQFFGSTVTPSSSPDHVIARGREPLAAKTWLDSSIAAMVVAPAVWLLFKLAARP